MDGIRISYRTALIVSLPSSWHFFDYIPGFSHLHAGAILRKYTEYCLTVFAMVPCLLVVGMHLVHCVDHRFGMHKRRCFSALLSVGTTFCFLLVIGVVWIPLVQANYVTSSLPLVIYACAMVFLTLVLFSSFCERCKRIILCIRFGSTKVG